MKLTSLAWFGAGLLSLFASCGGGGGSDGGSTATTSADILLTDAPADELSAFNVLVEEVRLYDAFGERSENLMAGPVRVNLLSAATQLAWLVSKPVPAGTWRGVELSFNLASVDARKLDGTQASVTTLGTTLQADFSAPVAFQTGGYQRVVVDFDLAASLTGDATLGYTLDPQGVAFGDDNPTTPLAIDSIVGRVKGVDTVNNLLSIDAWADDDRSVLLGTLQVEVQATDVLQDDAGALYADLAAFYAALVPDASFIEVHGLMTANGVIDATRIEVDEGVGGGDAVVRLRGVVLAVDAGASTFDIGITEVKKGYSTALAAFGGLSIPASMSVSYDVQTYFGLAEGAATTSASLAVGLKVDLRFVTFASAPFTAARVEMEAVVPEFEGTVTNISNLFAVPPSFEITMAASAPQVLSGAVIGALTVNAAAVTTIYLDCGTEPNASLEAVQLGQRVAVRGTQTVFGSGAVVGGTQIRIIPGRCDAVANIGNLGDGRYEMYPSIADFDTNFGGLVGTNAEAVFFIDTVYTGDVSTYSEFIIAVENDMPKPELRIQGIAAIGLNRIEVYEVEVRRD